MAVNRVPVLKRCRSLGLEPTVLGIDKKSNRESKRANKKISEYGLQLREKQKAKFIYGVLEKPFRNYYEKADRMKGMTGENLLRICESRLDNVVYRLGFAASRKEARQLVRHNHFTVNGKKANIPSILLKSGDLVAVASKSGKLKEVVEAMSARPVVKWLDCDKTKMTGRVIELPHREDIDLDVEEHLIVELYSK